MKVISIHIYGTDVTRTGSVSGATTTEHVQLVTG